VSEDLLKEMGVRLVSIDRPGYGRSDKNQSQTFESFATEIAEIADLLALGEKFWLLAYSGGGSYCWAAIRYIPHRIAGVAMWAPYGNYWWKVFFVAVIRTPFHMLILLSLQKPSVTNINSSFESRFILFFWF
jgi:pimeloyl-ACP methyl ester carboxylesterase